MRLLKSTAFIFLGGLLAALAVLWALTAAAAAAKRSQESQARSARTLAAAVSTAISGDWTTAWTDSALAAVAAAGEAHGIAVGDARGMRGHGALAGFRPPSAFRDGRLHGDIFLFHVRALGVAASDSSWVAVELPQAPPPSSLAGEPPAMVLGLAACLALAVGLAVYYQRRNSDLLLLLDERRRRAAEADELSLAAAGLAHETKNPLGVIRGLAQRIAEGRLCDAEVRAMARDIMEEADVTTARLGDFICYAKMREPEMAAVSVREAVGRVAELLSGEFKAAGVSLECDCEDVWIEADPDMLRQILVNLLLNSLRATPAGGRVCVSSRRSSKGTAALAVRDSGPGFPPDVLPLVFKPYTTRKASGYGIGLPIVKRMADKSGWTVSVSSPPGGGAEVCFKGIRLAASCRAGAFPSSQGERSDTLTPGHGSSNG